MTSAALGSIGIGFEPTSAPGEQVDNGLDILVYQAVAASFSATNQPTGSVGMRLHVYVYANTATGTVTIAGKDINGNAITETVPSSGSIPIFPVDAQSQETGRFDYCTTNVFGSINASGITTTGLTGGFIKIGGIYGAKVLIPGTAKINAKYGEHSPDEHRALGDRHTHKIQTIKDCDVELDMAMYPDASLFVPYVMANSVTNPSTPTTSPGSPVSCLAATAVSGSPLSLTTQPTAPGMKFTIVIASSTAIGTVALTGLDIFGRAQTETIVCGVTPAPNGNGTYYSSNVYSAINAGGVVVTGLTTGTIAITAQFSWNRAWLPSLTPQTSVVEWFTGAESSVSPFAAWMDFDFAFDVGKEFSFKAKAIAQDKIAIGLRSGAQAPGSLVSNLAQPIDRPDASWSCQVFIDPITGTPGTTAFADMISGNIKITNVLEGVHTLQNKQVYGQVSRSKWAITLDAKLIYNSLLQLEQFRQDKKQYIQLNFYGKNVGSSNVQTIIFIIPFKFEKFEVTSTPAAKFPEVAISGIGEYDPFIGASYKMQWLNSQQPPTYNS